MANSTATIATNTIRFSCRWLPYFENNTTMKTTTIKAIYNRQPMLNDFSALARCFFADSMSPRSNASRADCLSSMENKLPPLNQNYSVALCSSISALIFSRASSRSSRWQRISSVSSFSSPGADPEPSTSAPQNGHRNRSSPLSYSSFPHVGQFTRSPLS